MAFRVIYKPLAQIEAAEAYQWYAQPHIGMSGVFLDELERTNQFIASNPYLYSCVEVDVRRANLSRFPYFAVLRDRWRCGECIVLFSPTSRTPIAVATSLE